MALSLDIIDGVNEHIVLFFIGAGYLNGWLFRAPDLWKLIAIFIITPSTIGMLIKVDLMYMATIPFLLAAIIGYWGIDKTKYKILDLIDAIRYR